MEACRCCALLWCGDALSVYYCKSMETSSGSHVEGQVMRTGETSVSNVEGRRGSTSRVRWPSVSNCTVLYTYTVYTVYIRTVLYDTILTVSVEAWSLRSVQAPINRVAAITPPRTERKDRECPLFPRRNLRFRAWVGDPQSLSRGSMSLHPPCEGLAQRGGYLGADAAREVYVLLVQLAGFGKSVCLSVSSLPSAPSWVGVLRRGSLPVSSTQNREALPSLRGDVIFRHFFSSTCPLPGHLQTARGDAFLTSCCRLW